MKKELFLVIEIYEIRETDLLLLFIFSLWNPVNNNKKRPLGILKPFLESHAYIFNTFQREYVNCDSPSEQWN